MRRGSLKKIINYFLLQIIQGRKIYTEYNVLNSILNICLSKVEFSENWNTTKITLHYSNIHLLVDMNVTFTLTYIKLLGKIY